MDIPILCRFWLDIVSSGYLYTTNFLTCLPVVWVYKEIYVLKNKRVVLMVNWREVERVKKRGFHNYRFQIREREIEEEEESDQITSQIP